MRKYFILFIITCCFEIASCNHTELKFVKSRTIDSIFYEGHVTTSNVFKHTFFIKNIGNDFLKIDSVTASCNCIDLNWQKKAIKPGETGFIQVNVIPNLKDKGKVVQYIMVRTNASNPFTIFRIFYIH